MQINCSTNENVLKVDTKSSIGYSNNFSRYCLRIPELCDNVLSGYLSSSSERTPSGVPGGLGTLSLLSATGGS